MRRRDPLFAGSVLLLTALIPGPLAALSPLAEERSTLGFLVGWGLALVIMVPSYVLLSRGMDSSNSHVFLRNVLAGMLMRLFLSVAGVIGFATLVSQPPLWSFLLAFFLGYALLTAVELVLATRRRAGGVSA